jgi:hypothetical protein
MNLLVQKHGFHLYVNRLQTDKDSYRKQTEVSSAKPRKQVHAEDKATEMREEPDRRAKDYCTSQTYSSSSP